MKKSRGDASLDSSVHQVALKLSLYLYLHFTHLKAGNNMLVPKHCKAMARSVL